MTEFTPTTPDVKIMFANQLHAELEITWPEALAAFERWYDQVRQEAKDEERAERYERGDFEISPDYLIQDRSTFTEGDPDFDIDLSGGTDRLFFLKNVRLAPTTEEHSRDSLGICRKCGEGISARDLVDGEDPCQGYQACGKGPCASPAGHEGECGY